MTDNINANQRQAALFIAPDQLISALIGADAIELQGFGGIPARLPFWVPVISELKPSSTPAAAARARSAASKIAIISSIAGALALAFLAFWAGRAFSDASPLAQSQSGWHVKAVEQASVLVQVGVTQARVPVGSILPNGEILRSVDPDRRSFATDTLVTAVKP